MLPPEYVQYWNDFIFIVQDAVFFVQVASCVAMACACVGTLALLSIAVSVYDIAKPYKKMMNQFDDPARE